MQELVASLWLQYQYCTWIGQEGRGAGSFQTSTALTSMQAINVNYDVLLKSAVWQLVCMCTM